MTEISSIKIMRPGSVSSLGKNSSRREPTSRTQRSSKTSMSNCIVYDPKTGGPPREKSMFTQLSILFKNIGDRISEFMSHNNTTEEFRENFSRQLLETNRIFTSLENEIPRVVGESPLSRPSILIKESALGQKLSPFIVAWSDLSNYIIKIRESGPHAIHEVIDMHFTLIIDSLDSIDKSITHHSIVNDPLIKKLRSLNMHILNLKKESISVIMKSLDSTKITTELRNFSRTINSAFASDFTRAPLTATTLEKLRSQAYTSCCNIIHCIRDSISFETSHHSLIRAFDEFNSYLEFFFEKNGITYSIPHDISEIIDKNDFLVSEEYMNESLSLDDFINQGKILFSGFKHCDKYFGLLVNRINDALQDQTQKSHLKGIIEQKSKDMDKLSLQIESLKNQLTSNNDTIFAQKQELIDKENAISRLNNDIEQSVRYKQVVFDLCPQISAFINSKEHSIDFEDDDMILDTFMDLMDDVFAQKCERCGIYAERESKVNQVLSALTTPDDDPIVTAERCVTAVSDTIQANQLKSQEISAANQQIGSMREIFLKILSLFDQPKSKTVEIGEFTYQTIQEQLFIMKQQNIDSIEEKNRTFQEFSTKILKRFQAILGSSEIESIESCLFQIETQFYQNTQDIMKFKIGIDQIIEKLCMLLSIPKQNTLSIELIVQLIDNLDEQIRQSRETTLENESVSKQSIKILHEILSNLGSDPDSDNEADLIQQISQKIKANHDRTHEIETQYRVLSSDMSKILPQVYESAVVLSKLFGSKTQIDPSNAVETVSLIQKLTSRLERAPGALGADELISHLKDPIDILSLTPHEDPIKLLSELSSATKMLNNSILAMKPFASILNSIFLNFDSAFTNFDPSAKSFIYIKDQVAQLHSTINAVAPNTVHSIVFLVLSRFVTLVSSFVTVVSLESKPR